MSFDKNDYLSWYVPRAMNHSPDDINLHASGVAMVEQSEISPVPGDPFASSAQLEAALADWLGLPSPEIVFTPSGTGGTLLALLTLADQGDQLVVEHPIYEPMLQQGLRLGPVSRLHRLFDDQWRLDMDEAKRIITPKTSVVLITEPHNPSGLFSPHEDVIELADIAQKVGATLLINEVYRGYSEAPSYHAQADNIVVVSSLSKLIGAYWARIGWLSAPSGLANRLRHAHWNMGMPTAPGAQYGLGFMAQVKQRQLAAIDISKSGTDTVDSWVENTAGLSWHRPQGPGFGCVKLPPTVDDLSFAESLRGTLVVPGSRFEQPGTFRLSWLQAGPRLPEGLEILSKALSRLG